jgi:hypothetical protein
MKFCHLATNEWMTLEEIQKKFDDGFDFKCNACNESIGEHLVVLTEGIQGIHCKPCQIKTLSEIMDILGVDRQ